MKKLILMLTLIAMIGIVSEAKADSCTESSIQGVYSNIFGVPYNNRATGFIEIDENTSQWVANIGSERTSAAGSVTYYPPYCGCFEVYGSVKGLGNGYWTTYRYNFETMMLEIQPTSNIVTCFSSQQAAELRLYFVYWQHL